MCRNCSLYVKLMDVRNRKRLQKYFIVLVLFLALKIHVLNSTDVFDGTHHRWTYDTPLKHEVNGKVEQRISNKYGRTLHDAYTSTWGVDTNNGEFVAQGEKTSHKYIKDNDDVDAKKKEEKKPVGNEPSVIEDEDKSFIEGSKKDVEMRTKEANNADKSDIVGHVNKEMKYTNMLKKDELKNESGKLDVHKKEMHISKDENPQKPESDTKEINKETTHFTYNKEEEIAHYNMASDSSIINENTFSKEELSKKQNKKSRSEKKGDLYMNRSDKHFVNPNEEIIKNKEGNANKKYANNNARDVKHSKEYIQHSMKITQKEENKGNENPSKEEDSNVLEHYEENTKPDRKNIYFSNSEKNVTTGIIYDKVDTLLNTSMSNNKNTDTTENEEREKEGSEKVTKGKNSSQNVKEGNYTHHTTTNATTTNNTADKGIKDETEVAGEITGTNTYTGENEDMNLLNESMVHEGKKGDSYDENSYTNDKDAEHDMQNNKNEKGIINKSRTHQTYDYHMSDIDHGFKGKVLDVFFTDKINIYINARVGKQMLKLTLSSRLEGVYVFMKNSPACAEDVNENNENKNNSIMHETEDNADNKEVNVEMTDKVERNCYNPFISKSARWCNNSLMCLPPILTKPYQCYSENNLYLNNKVEYPSFYYDSLRFSDSHIEGTDHVELFLIDYNTTVDMEEQQQKERDTGTAKEEMKEVIEQRETKIDEKKETANGDIEMEKKTSGKRRDSQNTMDSVNTTVRGFNNNMTFESADIKLVTDITLYNKWHTFKDVDGILGLAGEELSCRNRSVWNALLEEQNFLFAFDINLPEHVFKKYDSKEMNETRKREKEKNQGVHYVKIEKEPNPNMSKIHIGDYIQDYGDIIWAEPRERGGIFSDSLLQFTIYNLEVCGTNIFGKYTSNWQGIIDLSSKCLILPKLFWLSVMEYLPINRNDKRCIPENKDDEYRDDAMPRMCSVDEINRPLPLLKFVFSDNDVVNNNNTNDINSSNMKEIHIPLDNLIISGDKENENYLCVLPDSKEGRNTEKNGRTTKPLIKFGTYVLNSLYVVADQDNYAVGFAQKRSYYYSNDKCTQPMTCIGDQHYEPALNLCVNPDCSIWYFYTLNEETKTCESLSFKFYVFVTIAVILLVVDIQSYYVYRKAVRIAQEASR